MFWKHIKEVHIFGTVQDSKLGTGHIRVNKLFNKTISDFLTFVLKFFSSISEYFTSLVWPLNLDTGTYDLS